MMLGFMIEDAAVESGKDLKISEVEQAILEQGIAYANGIRVK
jgi:hypothetical protein